MASFTEPLTCRLAKLSIRAACRLAVRPIDLRVEGLDHVPATGPVIFAARHFHHFYDGCALLAIVPRPLHIVVALDWLHSPLQRQLMMKACRVAGWPVVSRAETPKESGNRAIASRNSGEASQLRAATRDCVRLLRGGRSLLVFPEGFPNVDPGYTPKSSDDDFLPFKPGFLRFAKMAELDGQTHVSIVPIGLEYIRGDRWSLTVRFGPGVAITPGIDDAAQISEIEKQARWLSGLTNDVRPVWQRAADAFQV